MNRETHDAILDAWEEMDQAAGRLPEDHPARERAERATQHIKRALDAADMPWVRLRATPDEPGER